MEKQQHSHSHPHSRSIVVDCAIVTISDTRNFENDHSGAVIKSKLTSANHNISSYTIIPDDPQKIEDTIETLANDNSIQAIITTGGTGLSPRDNTPDVLPRMLQKELTGFGEIFRFLSYQEIGSKAIASRAIAGVYERTIIFALPGSKNAVTLALDKLILPEISHLVTVMKG